MFCIRSNYICFIPEFLLFYSNPPVSPVRKRDGIFFGWDNLRHPPPQSPIKTVLHLQFFLKLCRLLAGLDHHDKSSTARRVLPRREFYHDTTYRVSSQKYRAVAVVITPSSTDCRNHNVKTTDVTLFPEQFF